MSRGGCFVSTLCVFVVSPRMCFGLCKYFSIDFVAIFIWFPVDSFYSGGVRFLNYRCMCSCLWCSSLRFSGGQLYLANGLVVLHHVVYVYGEQ